MIINLGQYNEQEHGSLGLKKFAQIMERVFVFGKTHKVAHWIFYSESAPEFAPPCDEIIEITSLPDVTEGWFYNSVNGTFSDPESAWRSLYSDDELKQLLRVDRNRKIAHLDWLVLRHQEQVALSATTTLSAQEYQDLLIYKQALRDFPETANVRNPVWPTPPAFLTPSN